MTCRVWSRHMPDVVLPVLNEVEALPMVLAAMPPGYRAIVVDNGSTDGSGQVASALGATVMHESRRGFGSACQAGLVAATDEVVCFMDCDGSLDPADLPSVVAPVVAGTADLCIGERHAESGAWPLHARVLNRALAFEVRRRTGLRLRDLGPMRAARRRDLIELGIMDRRLGWPLEMVLRAVTSGQRVIGVPVSYGPRQGRSKVTGSLGGTLRAIHDMSRVLL
jgi:glycosyltransferase involved in cell wall biosynthesis